jgi:dipeptidyl aminopeptidase/acylaminoacyl peptidase
VRYRIYPAAILGIVTACAGASAQDHPFTVKDDIAMVRFSEPFPQSGVSGSEIAPQSPDGRYFAVITNRGLLKSDQTESQVVIFSQDKVRAFMQSTPSSQHFMPHVVAAVVGSMRYAGGYPYATVIEDLRWSADGASIYFKGESSSGAYQLYEAKIDGSGFRALTPAKWSVDRYDIEKDMIAYTASLPDTGTIDQGIPINRDAWRVTGLSIADILFPSQNSRSGPENFSVWVMKKSHGEWKSTWMPNLSFRDERSLSFLSQFKLSPEGDKLIGLAPVTKVPALWQSYDPAAGYEHTRLRSNDPELTRDTELNKPQEYSLIDLVKGKSIPLVDAPNALSLAYVEKNRVAWAPDERRALVTNTFLPLDQGTLSARSAHTTPCAVASVDIPSLHADCLLSDEGKIRTDGMRQPYSEGVLDIAFGVNDDEVLLLIDHGSGKRTVETYRFNDGAWKSSDSMPVSATAETVAEATTRKKTDMGDIQLVVKQSLNDPPTLWAQDKQTAAERQLWDPNPQFAHIEFGNASLYQWKDKTGHEWTGGLVKPVGYVPGRRYPLVIQMYKFYNDEFMTNGSFPSAFAARELASAGIMVLVVEKYPNTLSYVDPEMALNGYRSAIEHLSEAGLIDSSKVGVVGFSASCWLVGNALVNAPHLFAAATIADGIQNSYMEYHFAGLALREQMEKTNGSKPFGEGLKTWVNEAVGFHLDRVQTPVRVEAITPLSILGEWELYSSLQIQNKPVDLIYFPNGTHIHQKPLERLESQQGDVDWMRFWLQGYEDSDPSKADQYKRWEHLRELQDAENKADSQPIAAKPH